MILAPTLFFTKPRSDPPRLEPRAKLVPMSLNEISDGELIAQFTGKDHNLQHAQEALSTLYDRYIRAALGLATQVLFNREEAEEVVQDCFLKVWDNPGIYRAGQGSFAAFFMTMIRNRSVDYLRKRRDHSTLEDEEGNLLPIKDLRESPLERTELSALGDTLQTVLKSLSAAHRETVERAFYREESREEIAEAMNVPVGTVKSRLKYALDKLRNQMKGREWE
jgi:RNA polymerase sigma-70 factor, ECF subfamily